jgi:hypothetical protein
MDEKTKNSRKVPCDDSFRKGTQKIPKAFRFGNHQQHVLFYAHGSISQSNLIVYYSDTRQWHVNQDVGGSDRACSHVCPDKPDACVPPPWLPETRSCRV